MSRCPWCNRPMEGPRSAEISTRFNGHVTWMTRELHGQYTREQVYWFVLLKACEIEPPAGGDPYPYTIVGDRLFPERTSGRTNKEMMTACEACNVMAVEWELGLLPERYDEYGAPMEPVRTIGGMQESAGDGGGEEES